jgi:hypothetical protein
MKRKIEVKISNIYGIGKKRTMVRPEVVSIEKELKENPQLKEISIESKNE